MKLRTIVAAGSATPVDAVNQYAAVSKVIGLPI